MSTYSVVRVIYERPESQLIESDTHVNALMKSEGVRLDDDEAREFYSQKYRGGNGLEDVDDYVKIFWHQEGWTIITKVMSH